MPIVGETDIDTAMRHINEAMARSIIAEANALPATAKSWRDYAANQWQAVVDQAFVDSITDQSIFSDTIGQAVTEINYRFE